MKYVLVVWNIGEESEARLVKTGLDMVYCFDNATSAHVYADTYVSEDCFKIVSLYS